jgi:cyclophilin family peptidyl-prolyl cis-trans isomerase
MKLVTLLVAMGLIAAGMGSSASAQDKPAEQPHVLMKTSVGDIVIRLDPENAPISVENFLRYVDEGFYNGTIFHRVMKGFMIQGGGFDQEMKRKETHEPIKNEAANGLANRKFTVAMARTNVVDSATAQFFINTVDNRGLDHRSPDPAGYGYAVFGRVVDGMEFVQEIEAVPTTRREGHANAPVEPVVIESVTRHEM